MTDVYIAVTRGQIDEQDITTTLFKQQIKNKINIITLPTITAVPINSLDIQNTIKKIEEGFYQYFIFASSNSVNIFFETVKKESSNIIYNLIKSNDNNANSFIAIGPKTKEELEKNKIKAVLAGSDYFSNAIDSIHNNRKASITFNSKFDYSINRIIELLDKIEKNTEKKKKKPKILMPRSLESLKSKNYITKTYKNLILDQVFFYETKEFDKVKESVEWKKFKEIVSKKKILHIIFTSPSTVRSFFNIVVKNFLIEKEQNECRLISNGKNDQELLNNLGIRIIISLGPKTSEELKKRNVIYTESKEHTVKGALNDLLKLIDNQL